jgi:GTPase
MMDELAVREFDAEVKILHHATTIQPNYQAVLHCGAIRQTVRAINIVTGEEDKNFLRTNETGLIKFKFMYYPEMIKVGQVIVFREGRTKGQGYITHIYP